MIEVAWFDASAAVKCPCGLLAYIDPGETECECGRVYTMATHIKQKGTKGRTEVVGPLPMRKVRI